MRRVEVTEPVADQEPKIYQADYLGSISQDGKIIVVVVLDNGDLKPFELDVQTALSKADFKFI